MLFFKVQTPALKSSQFLFRKFYPVIHIAQNHILIRNYTNSFRVQLGCRENLLPSFIKAQDFPNNPAIYDKFKLHSYGDLLTKSCHLSNVLSSKLGSNFSNIHKVSALLCPNDSRYIISMWGSWMVGSLVVPLSGKHPENLLNYFLEDSSADVLITTADYRDLAEKLKLNNRKLEVINLDEVFSSQHQQQHHHQKHSYNNNNISNNNFQHDLKFSEHLIDQPALIVYTSGTTGKPKGAIHTHKTISTMVNGMIDKWGWSQNDVILHALPLNHVHGVINALLTPLTSGACCVMMPKFDPDLVWGKILNRSTDSNRPNIFMGVPTMYNMLMDSFQQMLNVEKCRSTDREEKLKEYVKRACMENMRLFVSGSAPLPLSIIQKWEELTGHVLLERYGMTELGMVFTNPLMGPREPGYVGRPFPLVEVAVAKNISQSKRIYKVLSLGNENETKIFMDDDDDDDENDDELEVVGELLVRGETVFKGYLNKEEATKLAFTSDGWFITGDTVSYSQSKNSYKILGRTSVDVIKHGGFKLSALEIENYLLKHPLIKEVAVLGVKDEKWGQKVVALVTLKNRVEPFNVDDVRRWCAQHMARYQIPSEFVVVNDLKRNAMGKINKTLLLKEYFNE